MVSLCCAFVIYRINVRVIKIIIHCGWVLKRGGSAPRINLNQRKKVH